MERIHFSIVVSVYNEEAVLQHFHDELEKTIRQLDYDVEIIYVDDGSSDGSRLLLDRLVADNPYAKAIHFSRNFGHEAAMIAGIDHANGDGIVCMDADLQNPPAMLPQIMSLYAEGYDVVTMVREDRADGGWLKHITSGLFYRIINRMSDAKLQPNASDFFMVSRRVAEVLRKDYRERTRFLRGLIQTVGFRSTTLAYRAPRRAAGHSKYPMTKLASLAFTSIASFSKAPLKLGIYSGLLFGLLSVALIVYSIVMWIVDRPVGGYTTLIIFLSAFAAVLLLVVGITGYYVGIVLDEAKGRPIYLIDYTTKEKDQ